jgi:proline iminopeptidase
VHELYFEESGNPRGKPVVFLHGGPGGGTDPEDAPLLRSEALSHRAVRPARLRPEPPHASLQSTTPPGTWSATSNALREHLGIERWQVFGGSWGSTLALAYAQAHPARVTELVLRGIFLLRRWEFEWFYEAADGAAALFPDLWEYVEADSRRRAGRHDGRLLPAADQRRSQAVRNEAARAWSIWEGATSYLRMDPGYVAKFEDADYAAAFARIECHYFVNGGFLRR